MLLGVPYKASPSVCVLVSDVPKRICLVFYLRLSLKDVNQFRLSIISVKNEAWFIYDHESDSSTCFLQTLLYTSVVEMQYGTRINAAEKLQLLVILFYNKAQFATENR